MRVLDQRRWRLFVLFGLLLTAACTTTGQSDPQYSSLIERPKFEAVRALAASRAPRTTSDDRLSQLILARADALDGERRWSCVPFARELSGFNIRGDAWRWWERADGRYRRGHEPEVGAVLVLAKTSRLSRGHLAVVTEIVDERTIEVTHANWGWTRANRGRVHRSMLVIDASEAGDWSQTRFRAEGYESFGRIYPAYGFIYQPATVAARPETLPEWQG